GDSGTDSGVVNMDASADSGPGSDSGPSMDSGPGSDSGPGTDSGPGADSGPPATDLRAFPTAEGYGRDTVGGRGGRVIKVTNLNDSGPGSFREACEASGPRTVVFEVGGRIDLESTIVISNPFITIAGQHSVGDGIMLTKESGARPILEIATDEVIIRYLRFRRSEERASGSNPDNLWMNRGNNIVVDHCSFAWASDGNLDIANYDGQPGRPSEQVLSNITVQYTIFTNPYGGANKNHLVSRGPSEISWWRNAWLSTATRNPSVSTPEQEAPTWDSHFEHVNNFHYDYSNGPSYNLNDTSEAAGIMHTNVINNMARENTNSEGIVSPNVETYPISSRRWLRATTQGNGMQIFVQGNITPYRPNDTYDEWEIGQNGGGQADRDVLIPENLRAASINDTPIIRDGVPLWAPAEIWANFRGHVGASLPTRDSEDARAVSDVDSGESSENNTENTFPIIEGGSPLVDSDEDGMPDDYEMETYGSLERDGTGFFGGSVYTDLETYLNLRAQENRD
ncbi:MAG: hypothetical protein AB8H86_32615, partial [Polyangiales bacterium]